MPNRKRSVLVQGRATSISLEDDFWSALTEIADANGTIRPQLIHQIDRERNTALSRGEIEDNLSSYIRVYVLRYYRARAVLAARSKGRK